MQSRAVPTHPAPSSPCIKARATSTSLCSSPAGRTLPASATPPSLHLLSHPSPFLLHHHLHLPPSCLPLALTHPHFSELPGSQLPLQPQRLPRDLPGIFLPGLLWFGHAAGVGELLAQPVALPCQGVPRAVSQPVSPSDSRFEAEPTTASMAAGHVLAPRAPLQTRQTLAITAQPCRNRSALPGITAPCRCSQGTSLPAEGESWALQAFGDTDTHGYDGQQARHRARGRSGSRCTSQPEPQWEPSSDGQEPLGLCVPPAARQLLGSGTKPHSGWGVQAPRGSPL